MIEPQRLSAGQIEALQDLAHGLKTRADQPTLESLLRLGLVEVDGRGLFVIVPKGAQALAAALGVEPVDASEWEQARSARLSVQGGVEDLRGQACRMSGVHAEEDLTGIESQIENLSADLPGGTITMMFAKETLLPRLKEYRRRKESLDELIGIEYEAASKVCRLILQFHANG